MNGKSFLHLFFADDPAERITWLMVIVHVFPAVEQFCDGDAADDEKEDDDGQCDPGSEGSFFGDGSRCGR